MSFWQRKINELASMGSTEYEKVTKRIIELSGRIEELENKLKILETNYNNLRGNFNRKLSGLKEEVAPKEETENNIKSNMFLSPDGSIL